MEIQLTNMEKDIKINNFPTDYKPFLQDILAQIQNTRYEMLMSVSKKTLLLYWSIGSAVSEKIRSTGWGESVIEKLAKDLQTEIPGVRGFSARNIRNMKRFYEFYAPLGIEELNSATTVAELQKYIPSVGWVQNCVILEKCKDLKQIIFYLKQNICRQKKN